MAGDDAPFDEEVAKGVREADPDALAAVYRALVRPLMSYLRAQLRDEHVAQDLVADTFAEFVRSCRTIEGGPFQMRGWLYRAAHRNMLDHHRHRRRHPEDAVARMPEQPVNGSGLDDGAALREQVAQMRDALASLPAEQAQVLTLRFLGELSAPEVAVIMGKTEGAVRALQHRATAAMARMLRTQAVPINSPSASERSA